HDPRGRLAAGRSWLSRNVLVTAATDEDDYRDHQPDDRRKPTSHSVAGAPTAVRTARPRPLTIGLLPGARARRSARPWRSSRCHSRQRLARVKGRDRCRSPRDLAHPLPTAGSVESRRPRGSAGHLDERTLINRRRVLSRQAATRATREPNGPRRYERPQRVPRPVGRTPAPGFLAPDTPRLECAFDRSRSARSDPDVLATER